MKRRLRIGLVTYSGLPGLTASDRLFIPLFAERGVVAEPVVWSDPAVRWQDYSLVVLRSAWDSHLDPPAFARWLDQLADLGVKTLNPLGLVRQNQHKFYLRALEGSGVRIIPTLFIDRTDRLDLSAVRDGGWAKAVIKPAISANSYSTELFDVGDFRRVEQQYQDIARERDLLVQEFMPEIQRFGEISLVFINRRYSHTILKSARQTEFRVQAEYGGEARYFRARRAVVEAAETILHQFPGDILYARVDGVVRDKQFYLMEIELTDPELYFDHCPVARESFVEATMKLGRAYVGRGRGT
jgi:glutathione synthase/RimK-type ligase-like ATP-grasp enzyme